MALTGLVIIGLTLAGLIVAGLPVNSYKLPTAAARTIFTGSLTLHGRIAEIKPWPLPVRAFLGFDRANCWLRVVSLLRVRQSEKRSSALAGRYFF